MAVPLDKIFGQVYFAWVAICSNGLADFSVTKQGTKRLKRFADPHCTKIWINALDLLRGLKSFSEETVVLSKKLRSLDFLQLFH